ncbi:MAG: hypothetical protein IKC26_08080 [Clostridia bacterium]|nr:hypothetical protein [Clostridia bacterium]
MSPGYRTFTIAPHLCDLSEAFGAVCTPYGPIRAFVRVTEAGTIEIKYEAPKECEYVPQGDSYIRDDKIM